MPRANHVHEAAFRGGLRAKCGDDDLVNFEYYGGGQGSKANYLLLKLSERDSPITIPDPANKCVCGVSIEEQCYLRHKPADKLVVVGSCCVKRFMPTGLSRVCSECGEAHRNRKRDLCNVCWPKCHRCNAKLYDEECGRCWWLG